ncbi:MAG: hypothetical protein ACPGU7_02025 [Gammaproteobacteria bacterium]
MRLFVATSGHGLGHLSQVAPLVNALHHRRPDLTVIVQSTAPIGQIRERIPACRHTVPVAPDLGMLMDGPLSVRRQATFEAYRTLHERWDEALEFQCELLRTRRASLVIGDVPYLPLAAAASLDIPAFGVCSLNWAGLFRHYCGALGKETARRIEQQIVTAYDQGRAFLRCAPAMPMEELHAVRDIGPLVAPVESRRAELAAALGADGNDRIILVSPGGVNWRDRPRRWPDLAGVHWLMPRGWEDLGPRCHRSWALPFDFQTLVASVDALIAKPGYGLFTEAAQAGVPILTPPRGDWPEEPALMTWFRQHCPLEIVHPDALMAGDISQPLTTLLASGRGRGFVADGAHQGAEIILTTSN